MFYGPGSKWCLHLLLVYILNVAQSIENSYAKGKWTEKALIKDLLHDYEKRARPVVDGKSPLLKLGDKMVQQITIGFGLGLVQILELNENEQIFTVSVKSLYRWPDYHLVWNPEEYENITHITIPTDKIWIPDIALYNYADERLEERRECAARIDHNGIVEWHPMAIYKSTCPVKIKYFPYDRQVCEMRFGPWTYDSARVNISFYEEVKLNLKDYVASPEWNLLETDVVMRQRAYPCCPEVFSDMIFRMMIERQPAYYNYILILPCFLLSSLTLVLFWLPPETPAKMVLGMNIFVAFFLLLLLLQDSIPSASSSFPLIGNYYCINMTLVTLSTFLCLIVVNLHFRGDRRTEIPHWLRKLAIQHGARLLFVKVGPPGGPNQKSSDKKGAKGTNQPNSMPPYPDEAIQMYRQKYGFYPGMGMPYGDTFFPNAAMAPQNMGAPGDRFYPPNFPAGNRLRSYPGQRYPGAGPEAGGVPMFPPMGEGELQQSYYYGPTGQPYNRFADPRMAGIAAEDKSKACAFCPACAGLAAAAAAGQGLPDRVSMAPGEIDQVTTTQYPMSQYPEDPADELAAVWAAAVTGSAPHGKRSTGESRTARDENVDGIGGVRDRSMGPDLEAFLLQCIRPSESKKATMAANTRWTGENRPAMPTSPFYQFSSPHCDDDPDDADDESLQRWRSTGSGPNAKRDGERTVDEDEDDEENMDMESSGLWQRGSRTPFDSTAKRHSVVTDPEFLRRVQAVKRDVSEIVRGIRFMQRQNENKEKANKLIAEWRLVGMVLDRLFFVIYLLALGISILLYFPRSGDEKDDQM